jgi:hypothetical protein
LSQRWLPSAWSFSVGGLQGEDGQIFIEEISLTSQPAFGDARLLAAGQDAVDIWNLLTEQRAGVER